MADKVDELELLYKEKVRLGEVGGNHVESTFNDFKMLGGLGLVVIALAPMFEHIDSDRELSLTLFIIFLAVNIAITLIGLINLSKQLLINYLTDEVQILEEEIREKLKSTDAKTFRSIENWKSRFMGNQIKLALLLTILMSVITVVIPVFVLWEYSSQYAIAYFIIALFLSAFNLYAARIVHGKKW